MDKNNPYTERIEGPTPSGAAYAIAYYQGADGEPIEKQRAFKAEIWEYNSEDKIVSVSLLQFGEDTEEGNPVEE